MTTGLFIGLAMNSIVMQSSGYTFANAEAAALVARFTTPPTNARKALIDTLVGALKTAGVWTKLDAFYVMAAADAQAARRNWIADQYNLTAVSSPAFVADRGYSGDGVASYLDTGFNPTTAVSPLFTQNSAHQAIWSRTDLANGAGVSGELGASNSFIRHNVGAGAAGAQPNGAASLFWASGFPQHVLWRRSASNVWEAYRNGVDAGGGADASVAPTNNTWRICAIAGSSFGVNQNAAAHWGSNLTVGEGLSIYNALQTYMTAVGA